MNRTTIDDVILDPFVGSGTTAVAAVRTMRHYVGFDISAEYCSLTEHRIAQEFKNGRQSETNLDES